MAILTKNQIIDRVQKGEIVFKPNLDEFQVQAHAIDMRLGYTFLIPKSWHMTPQGRVALRIDHLDKNKPEYFEVVELEEGQCFELLPGEYVLASTFESVTIPNDLMAILYPRSSTNRKGLSVDLTGIVDSGYEGQLIIPIRNNTSSQVVKLYPGERFCQIVFERLEESVDAEKSRYHKKDIIDGFIMAKEEKKKRDSEEIRYVSEGKISALKSEKKLI
ncbi:MAG: dCTP deaminase [Candidatus Paceibacterota bacterium]|jgi:dCTP deaminase